MTPKQVEDAFERLRNGTTSGETFAMEDIRVNYNDPESTVFYSEEDCNQFCEFLNLTATYDYENKTITITPNP